MRLIPSLVRPFTRAMSTKVDVDAAQKLSATLKFQANPRDAIVYALGVGAGQKDLDLVYEKHKDFKVLPTYSVIPGTLTFVGWLTSPLAFNLMWDVPWQTTMPPFNPMMLVHGEQSVKIYKPFPTKPCEIVSTGRIVDILDKGKAALVILETESKLDGELLATNEFQLFVRGAGGFGGRKQVEGRPPAPSNDPPARDPDAVVEEKTSVDQAALYRLSGDYNPLHIDPEESSKGGFPTPILHGLCTFGYAGRAVFRTFCDSNPEKFKAIKVRFAAPVIPGETLRTEMWKEGNTVIFRVKVVERDTVVISNASVELA